MHADLGGLTAQKARVDALDPGTHGLHPALTRVVHARPGNQLGAALEVEALRLDPDTVLWTGTRATLVKRGKAHGFRGRVDGRMRDD